MKIKGRQIGKPKPTYCVFERDGTEFIFTIEAILDFESFNKICPYPEPPKVTKPGGKVIEDTNDAQYLHLIEQYGNNKTDWMILESIRNTEGLEWDVVNYDDPDTWNKYRLELEQSGLTDSEIVHLIKTIMECNFISENRMLEARDRFIHSQAQNIES
jgi:hypothetical protein